MMNCTFEDDSFCTSQLIANLCKVEAEFDKEGNRSDILKGHENNITAKGIDSKDFIAKPQFSKNQPGSNFICKTAAFNSMKDDTTSYILKTSNSKNLITTPRFSKRLLNKKKLTDITLSLEQSNSSKFSPEITKQEIIIFKKSTNNPNLSSDDQTHNNTNCFPELLPVNSDKENTFVNEIVLSKRNILKYFSMANKITPNNKDKNYENKTLSTKECSNTKKEINKAHNISCKDLYSEGKITLVDEKGDCTRNELIANMKDIIQTDIENQHDSEITNISQNGSQLDKGIESSPLDTLTKDNSELSYDLNDSIPTVNLANSTIFQNIPEKKLFKSNIPKWTNTPQMGDSKENSSTDSVLHFGSQDKLELSLWGLPEEVVKKYEEMGITKMFKWQVECLSIPGVLEGRNLIYSAPTSAGKTLVAEIILLKRVLEQKKKGIFILPFVSIAREKTFSLQRLFDVSGVRVEGFMGSQSPPGGFQKTDIAICTIEKANNIVNRLIENKKVDDLGIIVVDEMHMVGDSQRGYLLELLLTKLQYISVMSENQIKIQVIGMSATLPNLHVLSGWQNAKLYSTTFRPIPLLQMVKIGPTLYAEDFTQIRNLSSSNLRVKDDTDHLIQLCLETVLDGFSVLLFCPTKAWCEKIALSIASAFFNIGKDQSDYPKVICDGLRNRLNGQALMRVIEALRSCPAGLDSILERSLAFGAAFHHAGLTFDERDIIEGAFRTGYIPVLVATSTLSSGVNLPARRVIIRSPNSGGSVMDPLVYRQMIGRAGRKGKDTQGESILMCNINERKKAEMLVHSSLPPITSSLQRHSSLSSSLKRAILEIVVSGAAKTAKEMTLYWNCTLLAATIADKRKSEDSHAEDSSQSAIEEGMQYLLENELARCQEKENENYFVATQLGSAILASGLSPDEGLLVFSELEKARQCFVLVNELHVVYQVTPIYVSGAWPNLDWLQFLEIWESLSQGMKKVGQLVGVHESFIVRAMKGTINAKIPRQKSLLAIHQRFYAALALHDLVHEMSLKAVVSKYGATKGLLQALQQSAATFAGMVTVFCNRLGWHNLELLISQYQNRLHFGIQRDLCDLVRISLLNGNRARKIYEAGLETVNQVAHSDSQTIENVLMNSGPFQSRRGNNSKRDCGFILGVNGAPLTMKEASDLIISEARSLVQKELGLDYVDWNQAPSNEVLKSKVSGPNMNILKDINLRLIHDKIDVEIQDKKPHDVATKRLSPDRHENSFLARKRSSESTECAAGVTRKYRKSPDNERIKCGSVMTLDSDKIENGSDGGESGDNVKYSAETEKVLVENVLLDRSDDKCSFTSTSKSPSKDMEGVSTFPNSSIPPNSNEFIIIGSTFVVDEKTVADSDNFTSDVNENGVRCKNPKSQETNIEKEKVTVNQKIKSKKNFLFRQDKSKPSVSNDTWSSVIIPDSQEKPKRSKNVNRLKNKDVSQAVEEMTPNKKLEPNIVNMDKFDCQTTLTHDSNKENRPFPANTFQDASTICPLNNQNISLKLSTQNQKVSPIHHSKSGQSNYLSESVKAELMLSMINEEWDSSLNKDNKERSSRHSEDFFSMFLEEEEHDSVKCNSSQTDIKDEKEIISEVSSLRHEVKHMDNEKTLKLGQIVNPFLNKIHKTPMYNACSEDIDFGNDLTKTKDVAFFKRNQMQNKIEMDGSYLMENDIDFSPINDKNATNNESVFDLSTTEENESILITESGILSATRENIDKEISEFERSVIDNNESFEKCYSFLDRAFDSDFLADDSDICPQIVEPNELETGKYIENETNYLQCREEDRLVHNKNDILTVSTPVTDKVLSSFNDLSSLVLTPGTEAILDGKLTIDLKINPDSKTLDSKIAAKPLSTNHSSEGKSFITRTSEKKGKKVSKVDKFGTVSTYNSKIKLDINSTFNINAKTNPKISRKYITNNDKTIEEIDPTLQMYLALQGLTFENLEKSNSISVIEVTSNKSLFNQFINEWKSKEVFSISLTSEKTQNKPEKGVIGGRLIGRSKRNRSFTKEQNTSGVRIDRTDLILTGLAVSWGRTDLAYYIVFRKLPKESSGSCTSSVDDSVSLEQIIDAVKSVLSHSFADGRKRTIKMWDTKDCIRLLGLSGIPMSPASFEDPRVADWLLDPEGKEKDIHNMVMAYAPELAYLLKNFVEINTFKKNSNTSSSSKVKATTECLLSFHLSNNLNKNLEEFGLRKSFAKVEMPSIYVLALMELNGLGFSKSECQRQRILMEEKLELLEKEAFKLVGRRFSISSPDEVSKIIYNELQLGAASATDQGTTLSVTAGRTRRGKITKGPTNKEALEKLKDLHPLPMVISEWRRIKCALTKVVYPLGQEATYCSSLSEDRIFPISYSFTATGRITFHEPNVQFIPKDFSIELPCRNSTPKGKKSKVGAKTGLTPIMHQLAPILDPLDEADRYTVSLRHAIIGGTDRVLLAADYSQLELRILAHFSGDANLVQALNEGKDVFNIIASQVYSVAETEVTYSMRQNAKQICYGIIYGMGDKTLADELKTDEETASAFMLRFHQSFPSIRKFINKTVEGARISGYVITLNGRRRYLPGIQSSSLYDKGRAERQAVNTRIQGTGADIAKKAMTDIQKDLAENFPSSPLTVTQRLTRGQTLSGAYLILQLHDELIYEVVSEDVIQVAQIVKNRMENSCSFSVPLPVNIKVGPTWGTLQTLNL